MKILFLSTHANTGGITSYLLTLTKGLIRRGHHVHLVSSGGDHIETFQKLGAKTVILNLKTKSELNPKIYGALLPLKNYIDEQHIDVIHAQTRVTQVMGTCLKIMTRKPCVSTCHGFFKNRLSRRLFSCWGDHVIAISSQVKDHLQNDFHLPSEKIVLIENGIDLEMFPLVNASQRASRRKEFQFHDEVIIGMIARLSDVKGQDILIRAMPQILKHFPDTRLLLVGQGKMEGELKTLTQKLGLDNHVRFYPVVNQTAEMLPIFDVICVPSRQEGLGLSIMEAQATGIPVVASNVGGIPTLIEEGKTGLLVEAGNPDALAQAVVSLLQDKNKAQSLGQAARRFIEEKYSAEKMVEKTVSLYKKLMV